MSNFLTIVFVLFALPNAPALDDGIDPIMQPVIAHDTELQIGPITRQDIEQVYFRWGIKNEQVLGHTSVRLGLSRTPARFMNILGNVESGISDDLLVLVKSTDGAIGLRVAKVQKIRYKMVQ